jgi:hypothetical protein
VPAATFDRRRGPTKAQGEGLAAVGGDHVVGDAGQLQ